MAQTEYQVFLTFPQINELIESAHDAEDFLHTYVGKTADWPIKLTTDNENYSNELARRLQRLRDALAPIRPPKAAG